MTLATKFLSLPPERRGLVFEQAAAGLAGHDVILEKDFWVSWLLGLLFAQPALAPFLVFKGGTSLSKVFWVIDRFSEDIDLCLMPEFVGAALGLQLELQPTGQEAAKPLPEGQPGWWPVRIALADYPQLKALAWHVQGTDHLNLPTMTAQEQALWQALQDDFGKRVAHV